MMKKHKRNLLITSLVILLPIIAGVILWNKLPQQMPVHWGVDGTADGWTGRIFGVFVLPILLLALQWLGAWVTAHDHRRKQQSDKVFTLVLWLIPAISLLANGAVYCAAMGYEPKVENYLALVLGLLFTVIGNYLPKCRQNNTIGIKIKWTLENEENWNATHRLAGRVWMAGGIVILACIFLPQKLSMAIQMPAALVIAFIPVVYSYLYHLKQLKAGTAEKQPLSDVQKRARTVSLPVLLVLFAMLGVFLFTGDVEVTFGQDAMTADATYWSSVTVPYDAIDSVEYREQFDAGSRINGYGGARLAAGTFRNDEFGTYTLYACANTDGAVVIQSKGRVLVIRSETDESTKAICDTLLQKLPQQP